MERHKVIIAGSRDFSDYLYLLLKCSRWLENLAPNIEIVSGGARGADRLGERYARDMDYKLTVFEADWDTYGKSAGYKRNAEMADYADYLIAFWDGKSKGTEHMINLAKQKGLKIKVFKY